MTVPAAVSTQTQALILAREQQLYQTAMYWMRGSSIYAISLEQCREQSEVIRDVKLMRGKMAEWNRDTFENLAAERISALRDILREAWTAYSLVPTTRLLQTIHQVEQTIGRIQGILSDKVQHLHTGEIKHKMYNFKDEFPEPRDNEIMDGQFTELDKALDADGATAEIDAEVEYEVEV